MLVAPEVSELDFSTAVSLQGYIIPSLTTRRVSTTVELADGQSFAIAGLLQEETREVYGNFLSSVISRSLAPFSGAALSKKTRQ